MGVRLGGDEGRGRGQQRPWVVEVILAAGFLSLTFLGLRNDHRVDELEKQVEVAERQVRVLEDVRWERGGKIAEIVEVLDVLSEVCKADGKCEAKEASDG